MDDRSTNNVLQFRQARPACLTMLQVARLQNGEAIDAAATAHAETCDKCRGAIRALRVATDAAQLEPIPAYMREKPARFKLPTFAGLQTWGIAGAAAAVLLAIALPRLQTSVDDGPAVLAKGGTVELLFTVMRNGQYVYEDTSSTTMKLEDGDRLRLRVAGAANTWVIVRAQSPASVDTVFAGKLPGDGFVPEGLRYTAGVATHLEVFSCAKAPTSADEEAACTKRDITL